MNIFKRLASDCVTSYANRLYDKAVKLAKERGKENYGRHYVISHPLNDRRLIVVTAKQHRQMCKEFNVPRNYLPVDCLEKQSWYYTAGASGKDGISFREEQIRRLAFVRMLLKKAKLI